MNQRFKHRIGTAISFLLLFGGGAFGLTSGPSLPEYTQFEQVDATDMVSLATGSFTYSIPVMTVPGPGLGFPIVLGYHGSPGVKDEASWVGLGWNLQAGAITRQVNNLPDDFSNVKILETITSNQIYGWSYSISYNAATIGISYKSNEGYGGFIGYSMKAADFGKASLSVDVTTGFGSARGMTGVALGLGTSFANAKGLDFGVGIGAGLSVGITQSGGMNIGAGAGPSVSQSVKMGSGSNAFVSSGSSSLASMGVSLSQKGGGGVGVSLMGASLGTSAKATMNSHNFSATIPFLTPVGLFQLSYNGWSAQLLGIDSSHYYGFLYADSRGMGCTGTTASANVNCNYSPAGDGQYRKKHEFLAASRPYDPNSTARLMQTAEDAYIVSAQGISGMFGPHRKEDGDYSNTLDATSKWVSSWGPFGNRINVDRTMQLGLSRNLLYASNAPNGDIYWRFNDDPGGSEFTDIINSGRDGNATTSTQSRKIEPKFGSTGLVEAFKITASDGTIYEFNFPLYNGWEEKIGMQISQEDPDVCTKQEIEQPYAYSWLLTSIKAPDYVDLGTVGISTEDIGGWVRFSYGTGEVGGEGKKSLQFWGTPYYDYTDPLFVTSNFPGGKSQLVMTSPAPRTGSSSVNDGAYFALGRNAAHGAKEIAYLTSIETPTHIAEFKTEPRLDNKPFKIAPHFDYLKLDPTAASIEFLPMIPAYSSSYTRIHLKLSSTIPIIPGIADSHLRPGTPINVEFIGEATVPTRTTPDPSAHCPYSPDATHPLQLGTTTFTIKSTVNTLDEDLVINDPNVLVYNPDIAGFNLANGCPATVGNTIKLKEVRLNLPWGNTNASRRLASISLKAKNFNGTAKAVSFVKFQTDYSLSPGTPNSDAEPNKSPTSGLNIDAGHGRLTLRGLTIGQSEDGPTLPHYAFEYRNNPNYQNAVTINSDGPQHLSNWVPWEVGNWDRWGNLCGGCSESYHEGVVSNGSGVSQGAWNLDRIVSPSGSEIILKYGPRTYNYVGKNPISTKLASGQYEMEVSGGSVDFVKDGDFLKFWIPIGTLSKKFNSLGLPFSSVRIELKSNKALVGVAVGTTRASVEPWPNQAGSCTSTGTTTMKCLAECAAGNGLNCDTRSGETYIYGFTQTIPLEPDIQGISYRQSEFWVGFKGWDGVPNDPVDWAAEYRVFVQVGPTASNPNLPFSTDPYSPFWESRAQESYANGVVVTDVQFLEPYSGKSNTIHYQYENGVTSSLPPTFSDYNDTRGNLQFGTEIYSGSPNVLYSKVTTTFNGKNRTAHYFLTQKDLPLVISNPSGPIGPTGFPKLVQAVVIDPSSLWGSLWKKEEFKDGLAEAVRTSTTKWGINLDQTSGLSTILKSQLPDPSLLQDYKRYGTGSYYLSKSQWETEPTTYFGLDQTVFSNRYFNGKGCYVGACPQSNIVTTQVSFKKFNPHPIIETVVEDGVKSSTSYYDFDYRTGAPLKNQQMNSDNAIVVSEKIPAYYRYQEMFNRNQLTQEFAQSKYYYLGDTYATTENPTQAISSSVTIWRPYDIYQSRKDLLPVSNLQAFRKFKTYTWQADFNATGTFLNIPGDQCTNITGNTSISCTSTYTTPLNSDWFLQEQVNRYDLFGHPTNVMDQRGINHTIIYGYGNGVQTAYVTNTAIPSASLDGKFEAFYESFENTDEVTAKLFSPIVANKFSTTVQNSKTGDQALEVLNSTGDYKVCFGLGHLEANKAYEASVWYFDANDGANSSTATRPGILFGKYGGCSSELHPNGVSGSPGLLPGDPNYGMRATGSRKWIRLSTSISGNQCGSEADLTPSMVCIYASKGSAGASVLYDELRVKPSVSYMSTFTYDPRGKITSTADLNEVVTRYEFDIAGNLTGIRNDDGELISEQFKKIGQR